MGLPIHLVTPGPGAPGSPSPPMPSDWEMTWCRLVAKRGARLPAGGQTRDSGVPSPQPKATPVPEGPWCSVRGVGLQKGLGFGNWAREACDQPLLGPRLCRDEHAHRRAPVGLGTNRQRQPARPPVPAWSPTSSTPVWFLHLGKEGGGLGTRVRGPLSCQQARGHGAGWAAGAPTQVTTCCLACASWGWELGHSPSAGTPRARVPGVAWGLPGLLHRAGVGQWATCLQSPRMPCEWMEGPSATCRGDGQAGQEAS